MCDYSFFFCFLKFREQGSSARAVLERSASRQRDANAHPGEEPEHVHTEDCKIQCGNVSWMHVVAVMILCRVA